MPKDRFFLSGFLALGMIFLPMTRLAGGSRMFLAQNQWLVSRYEKTAIQRSGYDYAPTVMKEESRYRMWWCGSSPTGNPYVDHIWSAESADGLVWNNIRVSLTPAPLALIGDPSVVRVGGTYYMFFTGTYDPRGSGNEIYLATSTDGFSWRKYPSDSAPRPVISLKTTTSGYGIGQPSAIFRQNRFWVYYTDSTPAQPGLFLASSLDGILFSPESQGRRVLDTNSADVKYSPGTGLFLMVHGNLHDRLFVSSSTDGFSWEPYHSWHYLAHSASKNKAFEGCLAGSPTGTIEGWTYYYYASHQGTPGKIEDPLSWDIEAGQLSLSALPSATTVFQFHTDAAPSGDYLFDTLPDTPPFYDYERRAFEVPKVPLAGLIPFYRLYHPGWKSHFYTVSLAEKNNALYYGFLEEGVLGYVSPSSAVGSVPLYRMYHDRGAHFYTTDIQVREQQKAAGFVDEGIACFVWPLTPAASPAPPAVSPGTIRSSPGQVTIEYDLRGIAGSFDARVEISYANRGFQGNNPLAMDPFARVSRFLRGNLGVASQPLDGFPAGLYMVRVVALDEQGRPASLFGESGYFEILPPAPPDQPPFGVIDSPAESAVSDGPLTIHGWALDDRGITSVEVRIDGIAVGNASLGFSRPDVQAAFPAYAGAGLSGYRLETNVSRLSSGTHQILLILVDTSGQSVPVGPRTFSVRNGGNQAPFGVLESPVEGEKIGAQAWVGGWLLDDRELALAELWINGRREQSLAIDSYRPDVAAVFPAYPNAFFSGFGLWLNTASWLPGANILAIRACDRQGLCVDLPPHTVVK